MCSREALVAHTPLWVESVALDGVQSRARDVAKMSEMTLIFVGLRFQSFLMSSTNPCSLIYSQGVVAPVFNPLTRRCQVLFNRGVVNAIVPEHL